MLNYIKSEIYRIVRSKSVYISFAFCMGAIFLLNFSLYYFKQEPDFPYATTKFAFSSIYTSMSTLIYFVVMICTVVQGDEYKYHTFKNSVAAGIKRNTIYFGRFIAEIITCLAFYVLICATHILLGTLLLENSGTEYLNIFLKSLVACIPLYMACIAVCHFLLYYFDTAVKAIGIFVLFFTVLPTVIKLAGRKIDLLAQLHKWLIPTMLSANFDEEYKVSLNWDTTTGFVQCYLMGFAIIIIFCILGAILFQKKELK